MTYKISIQVYDSWNASWMDQNHVALLLHSIMMSCVSCIWYTSQRNISFKMKFDTIITFCYKVSRIGAYDVKKTILYTLKNVHTKPRKIMLFVRLEFICYWWNYKDLCSIVVVMPPSWNYNLICLTRWFQLLEHYLFCR